MAGLQTSLGIRTRENVERRISYLCMCILASNLNVELQANTAYSASVESLSQLPTCHDCGIIVAAPCMQPDTRDLEIVV